MLIQVQKGTANILSEYISTDPILQLFMRDTVLKFEYDVENVSFFFVTDALASKKNQIIKEDILGIAMCIDQIHLYYSQKNDIKYDDYIFLIKNFSPLLVEAPTQLLEGIFKNLGDDKSEYNFSEGEGAILPSGSKTEEIGKVQEENIIQIATEKDIEDLYALCKNMGELAQAYSYETKEKYRMKLCDKDGRIYYIKKEEEIIAMAETSFESDKSVYICDVCTHPSHRNKGYITQIIKKLSDDLLKEGKGICISYENLSAGRIYKKLGFMLAGQYAVMEKKE